jgi:hypothetical protein
MAAKNREEKEGFAAGSGSFYSWLRGRVQVGPGGWRTNSIPQRLTGGDLSHFKRLDQTVHHGPAQPTDSKMIFLFIKLVQFCKIKKIYFLYSKIREALHDARLKCKEQLSPLAQL